MCTEIIKIIIIIKISCHYSILKIVFPESIAVARTNVEHVAFLHDLNTYFLEMYLHNMALLFVLLVLPIGCLSHMAGHQQNYMQGSQQQGMQQGHMQGTQQQGMQQGHVQGAPQQGYMQQGMPPQQGFAPQQGINQNLLRDKSHIQDKEHIKEHLQGVVDQPDVSKMSEEELQFHYFKMHDNDDNNKLDGCELIKSVLHWHVEESKMMGNQAPTQGTTKIFADQELTMMIDPILNMDDRNNDGFIDYPEFIAAQKSRGF